MRPIILASLAVFATSAPRAAAMPPLWHTLHGEVTAVELGRKRFSVRTVKTPSGFSLSWGPRTLFFRDGKVVPDTTLARGQQVTVRYRAPFFGPRLASRVFIWSGAK